MNASRPSVGRRVIGAAASLVVAVALVAGVPTLLWRLVGWPLPTELPSADEFTRAISGSTVSDDTLLGAIALLGWGGWVLLCWSLLTETWVLLRGLPTHRARFAGPFQNLARRLITSISLIAVTGVSSGTSLAAALPSVASSAEPAAGATISSVDVPATGSALSRADAPAAVGAIATEVQLPTVTVQRHDSYWAIAERTLGSGLRWREILDLNVGRALDDGTIITDGTLHAGWVLALPVDATIESLAAAPPSEKEPVNNGAGGTTTVVVERGDSLWSISEDRLELDLGRKPSDHEVAPYWLAVIDANHDQYAQPGDPGLIHPGQLLDLPSTSYEPLAAEVSPAPPHDETAESPTAAELPPSLPDTVEDSSLEGAAPSEANDTITTVTSVGAAESTTTTTLDTSAPQFDANAADDRGADESDIALPVAAVGGLSSVALAVGLKRAIARRRRRFARHHAGRRPEEPSAAQRDLHHAAIAHGDEELIDSLQVALGGLARSLAAAASARRPRLVRHSVGCLEILLDQPDTNAPAGWISAADGTLWTQTEPPTAEISVAESMNPAPLMVAIGQPEEDAQLYLDLEAGGLIGLVGDEAVATNLARSLVAELTLSPLAGTLRVVAVGDLVDEAASTLDHLTVVDSWHDISADLLAWAEQSHDTLLDHSWANGFVARGHDPNHDALVPFAVIASAPPPDELVAALRNALPAAVAVVAVGPFNGATAVIECEADSLNIDGIEIACALQSVRFDELAEMSSLLTIDEVAEHGLDAAPEPAAESALSSNASGSAIDGGPCHLNVTEPVKPPDFDVLVRLLGDIVVEGGEPLRPKATSVVAFIALNRSVSTERLEEACWYGAGGNSHRKRLRDVMTEARSALGAQHLPANRNGTYVAGPRIRTDLELFDWHVKRAAQVPAPEATAHYRAALGLVTGRPFSYPNAARASFGWVDLEHHATTWEYRIASVAQAAAELHLDSGDPADAIGLLRGVVQAILLSSAVVETLMRAHVADNDNVGAQRVYDEHAAALERAGLGDPEEAIERVRIELLH